MSAHHLMTLIKRTSPNVYEADIFNCSRHPQSGKLVTIVTAFQLRLFSASFDFPRCNARSHELEAERNSAL